MKSLSIVVAAIDRPHSLRLALLAYTRWDRDLFDIWVMDDSGAGRIVEVCEEFRGQLDLHVVKFEKPLNYWRGPEISYATGLAQSSGHYRVITQEGVAVPYDLASRLLRHFEEGHPVINVHAVGHRKPPLAEKMAERFKSKWLGCDELLLEFPIERFDTDHPNFYCATEVAWDKLRQCFPLADCSYGNTDSIILRHREEAGLPRFVPPDVLAISIGNLGDDRIITSEGYCKSNSVVKRVDYKVLW